MSKLTQKNAIINEVKAILGSSFDPSQPAKSQLSKEQIKTIKSNIFDGIVNGSISYNKDENNHSEVKTYINGLLSNHFRRAKELNGGQSYKPSSTGRSNKKDQILTELTKLLSTVEEGSEDYENVKAEIEKRKSELAASNAPAKPKKNLVTSVLPDSLKELAD